MDRRFIDPFQYNLFTQRGARARSPSSVIYAFDFRVHGRCSDQRETVSRADNLRDLLAAYDLLAAQPGLDSPAVGIVGNSYGSYLGAITTALRAVDWLALRAPALYKDADWEVPKVQLHKDPDFANYRRRVLAPENNRALRACRRFAAMS